MRRNQGQSLCKPFALFHPWELLIRGKWFFWIHFSVKLVFEFIDGNRIYTNKDIKLILHIKKLLRDEKYTIEGAKKLLKSYNIKEEEQLLTGTDDAKHKVTVNHTKNELSLFTSDEEKESEASQNDIDKKPLMSDLKELKSFLSELLKDIE